MLVVLSKWAVSIIFADRRVEFWMHDNHVSNVLRKVSEMQWSANGLDAPIRIEISLSQ